MQFCIISPTAGLERYATRSRTHLLLPQVHSTQYWEFYRKRRLEGDTLILDNGAYEGQKQNEELVARMKECYQEVKPQVVVLPDLMLQDSRESLHHSLAWNDTIRGWVDKGTETMLVPQSKPNDPYHWELVVKEICSHWYEYMIQWIGIPRCLATDISTPYARILACDKIKRNYPHMKVHCLGMVKGNPDELGYLAAAGCNSVDSSAPVWRGWNGYTLRRADRELWDELGTACNFDEAGPASNHIIEDNLEACGVERVRAGQTAGSRG